MESDIISVTVKRIKEAEKGKELKGNSSGGWGEVGKGVLSLMAIFEIL
jgi:hypothetical protein